MNPVAVLVHSCQLSISSCSNVPAGLWARTEATRAQSVYYFLGCILVHVSVGPDLYLSRGPWMQHPELLGDGADHGELQEDRADDRVCQIPLFAEPLFDFGLYRILVILDCPDRRFGVFASAAGDYAVTVARRDNLTN